MNSGSVGTLVATLTAVAGLIAAIVGVLKYFNYRTKRDRIAAVGTVFEAVVEALASDDDVKRVAAAIRLRRFFDPRAELATGGLALRMRRLGRGEAHSDPASGGKARGEPNRRLTSDELPYAADAVNVIVAILRSQPPGDFQKLLADALTRAPKELLVGADLQRTNLQNAWLGEINLPKADFYRADLSNASFKGGGVEGAQFYEARLVRTRFTRAKLEGANFFGADLSRADFEQAELHEASFIESTARRAGFCEAKLEKASFTNADLRGADFRGAALLGAGFDGARLAGAAFKDARGVPESVALRLGADGVHSDDDVPHAPSRRVFLSGPAVVTAQQQALVDRVAHLIEEHDGEVVRLSREDYPASGSCAEIRRLMGGCTAAAIVAVPQMVVREGTFRGGTPEAAPVRDTAFATPWNQVEAGMAIALDLPVMVVRSQVEAAGVFAMRHDASTLTMLDVDECGPLSTLDHGIGQWLRTLTSF